MNILSRKNRTRIVSCLLSLFIIDAVFVHKIHPMQMVFTAVNAAAWCARLLVAGCAALVQQNNGTVGETLAQEYLPQEKSVEEQPHRVMPSVEQTSRSNSVVECIAKIDEHVQTQEQSVLVSAPYIEESHAYTFPLDTTRLADISEHQMRRFASALMINWEKALAYGAHIAQRPLYQTYAHEIAARAAAYQSPCHVYSNNKYTIAIDTPVGTGYAIIAPYTPPAAQVRYEQERDRFVNRLMSEPELFQAIARTTTAFINNGQYLLAGDLFDRTIACLRIGTFAMPDRFVANTLLHAQRSLWYEYFHEDGSLCTQALLSTYAACKILKKYAHKNLQPQAWQRLDRNLFDRLKSYKNKNKRCKKCFHRSLLPTRWCRQWLIPNNFAHKVATNKRNQQIYNMVTALSCGDVAQAQAIKQAVNDPEVDALFTLCDSRRLELATEHKKSASDAYGIYRFINDPIYKNLPEHEKRICKINETVRNDVNQLLVTRHSLKQLLHKAWSIPHSAPALVHDALYTLLGDATNSAIGDIPQCIEQCFAMVNNPALSRADAQVLQRAFFLPNGVHKELAGYEHVQALKIPSCILQQEYMPLYRMLNHLLYLEQVSSVGIRRLVSEAVTALESILNEKNEQQLFNPTSLKIPENFLEWDEGKREAWWKDTLKELLPDQDKDRTPKSCGTSTTVQDEQKITCGSALVAPEDQTIKKECFYPIEVPSLEKGCNAGQQTLPGLVEEGDSSKDASGDTQENATDEKILSEEPQPSESIDNDQQGKQEIVEDIPQQGIQELVGQEIGQLEEQKREISYRQKELLEQLLVIEESDIEAIESSQAVNEEVALAGTEVHEKPLTINDFTSLDEDLKKSFNGWHLPKSGGGIINGRRYTQHALERMAPDIPEVRAHLELKARLADIPRFLKNKNGEWQENSKWKDSTTPRGIPPMVVEHIIKTAKPIINEKYAGTFDYIADGVHVTLNEFGDVITVIKKREKNEL